MAELKVNAEAVISAATSIKTLNDQINGLLPELQNAISKLDSSWDGEASIAGIGRFNEIKSVYPESRYKVVENYVNFLLQQIGEGYNQTEEANKSLAAAFK